MKKITPAQQKALDKLSELGKPSTSQEICAQITTMQSLQKAGRVKALERFGEEKVYGRECETIRWEIVPIALKEYSLITLNNLSNDALGDIIHGSDFSETTKKNARRVVNNRAC